MNAPAAVELSPQLKARCTYPKLRGVSGTVLFVQADYFIERECLRAFQELDWRVATLPLKPTQTFVERLLTTVVSAKPDLMFTVNHLGFDCEGALTRLLEALELPCLSWFVDSPAYILLNHRANAGPLVITPVWEKTYIQFLREFGFEHPFHLPLASDPGLFARSGLRSDWRLALTLVADSGIKPARKWAAMEPSFPGRERLIAAAADRFAEGWLPDDPSLLEEAAASSGVHLPPLTAGQRWELMSAAMLEANRRRRRTLVKALDGMNLQVFGDSTWTEILPPDAVWHGSADYYRDLPELYGASAVNLNVTSLQMPTGLNQRVFDVPLAGGFLLTDHREDLELLFDAPRETAAYNDPAELPELVRFYQARPDLRRRIATAAARRIMANHTYRVRLQSATAFARRAFGPPTARVAHPSPRQDQIGGQHQHHK